MTRDSNLTGKRVVICEDQGITVMLLERALTRGGLVVVGKARNGKEGVELVLREKPDIVLMDIVMPGQNGLQATRQIMARFPTCIVMLTANTDEDHMEQARIYGAAGYISKPVNAEDILSALQEGLHMFYDCHP